MAILLSECERVYWAALMAYRGGSTVAGLIADTLPLGQPNSCRRIMNR
jgi:hypothetical protein